MTSGPRTAPTDARADAPARSGVTDPGARISALLAAALDPEGLVATPGVTHAELVATTCDLVRQLLAVDECWLQPPGALADLVASAAADQGGAWLANPTAPVPHRRPGPRVSGAVGGAPVAVLGEISALVVFSSTPRAWSAADLHHLVRAASLLSGALESTLEQQLSPAQVARARYDDLRCELLTVLNHELRTPLASLTAGLELLADAIGEDAPAPVSTLIRRVQSNADRLVAIADNITILGDGATPESRVAAGVFDPPDAAAVVRLSVDACATPDGPVVRLDPPRGPLPVAVPAGDLREALDRVLDNAVKFTVPGGRVDVSVTERTGQLLVTIADTGIGVPEDEHHRIGQPFIRASNARMLEKQGAGLGLATASAILRRWGGSLSLEGCEGRGATVRLLLPRAEVPVSSKTH